MAKQKKEKPLVVTDPKKEFIKLINSICYSHSRYDVFTAFIELAYCALRKRHMVPGKAADAIEKRYMDTVKRFKPEDIRRMPELFALATLGISEGHCDYLGQVAGELELLNVGAGQFFTPYEVSRMIAELTLADVGEVIEQKGYVTIQEPACGAGGMILAAADVIESKGIDLAATVFVDATDVSTLCFQMTYLQTSLRGVPAMIHNGNTLSREMYESVPTPALGMFLLKHPDFFNRIVYKMPEAKAVESKAGQLALFAPAEPQTKKRKRA